MVDGSSDPGSILGEGVYVVSLKSIDNAMHVYIDVDETRREETRRDEKRREEIEDEARKAQESSDEMNARGSRSLLALQFASLELKL